MTRYSLFVLKVSLNTNKPTATNCLISISCVIYRSDTCNLFSVNLTV